MRVLIFYFTVLQEKLERMNSATALETALPRKVLLEQLSRILPADDSLPEQVRLNIRNFWVGKMAI